ncbi:MAG TPA: DUF2911 domain-containing protein [Planctomycetota bacterium]|nr:DUF2911 domain-containing protein [Planctomycetota bacterium]
MKQILFAAALLAVASTFASSPVHARPAQEPKLQFPAASPSASFTENIGLTGITVEYARPGVKGRKIFGGLVPYGEVWRTGANSTTKITFTTDVNFGGTAVPPGSYGLFTIPGEKEWTVILNKVVAWGAYSYDAKNDVARVKVKPAALPESLETMTISLSDVRDDSAQLSIAWEKTRVSVKIETDTVNVVKEQIDAAMAGDGKKPYFQAAMFYYEHDLDIKKAVTWIDAAIKEAPEPQVWVIYRKGLVMKKAGDKAAALEAAKQALDLAEKALAKPDTAALGTEYKHLSEALIASLK